MIAWRVASCRRRPPLGLRPPGPAGRAVPRAGSAPRACAPGAPLRLVQYSDGAGPDVARVGRVRSALSGSRTARGCQVAPCPEPRRRIVAAAPGFPPPDDGSVDRFFAAAYDELRRIAPARLREGGRNVVLDTTALVHEPYLKLSKAQNLQFPDRPRFLVYARKVMRSIFVDMVRQRQAERHGGGVAQPHPDRTGRRAGRFAGARGPHPAGARGP